MGKLLWCTLFWGSSLLGKQAEEKHSIGGCCCGQMQLSGNAANWGTEECTAVNSKNFCSTNSAVVTNLFGELGNCRLLAGWGNTTDGKLSRLESVLR